MSFFLVFSFFFFFFGGCIKIGRGLWYIYIYWVGNKRRKNKQNRTFSHLNEKKKAQFKRIFICLFRVVLVCNGKMKLKSDIRIKILNDRYRPIDLYVFKKKQTKKKKKRNKKKIIM